MGKLVRSEAFFPFIAELRRRIQLGSASTADRLNLRLLEADGLVYEPINSFSDTQSDATRVAIVSLLFNWPSTGGGIVHTAELATFLTRAGYEVCHFFAVHEPLGVGSIGEPLPYTSEAIRFGEDQWNANGIRSRFQAAVARFSPDSVIVTDSWNTKPVLAEAVSEWPYFLRLAAMECLCPLNNVRLICDNQAQPQQCHNTQLANRSVCTQCVKTRIRSSGGLHTAERQLAEFENPHYGQQLIKAFAGAEAVLAVNDQIAALVEPYAQRVEVIPSGFDPSRFIDLQVRTTDAAPFRILFAGLVNEYMKGAHVILQACRLLWDVRQDFELWVTADDIDPADSFAKPIGWQSQTELPHRMAQCDVVVVPTVAQEALGRTAVEAMGAGRAVIASRLGGLKEVVSDGLTGLLVNPADPTDLMHAIEMLMNNRELASQLGENGRRQFELKFPWESIIEHKYKPLLHACRRRP